MPKPSWGSMVSVTDGSRVPREELDEMVVKHLLRVNKGKTLEDLKGVERKLPMPVGDEPEPVVQVVANEDASPAVSHSAAV